MHLNRNPLLFCTAERSWLITILITQRVQKKYNERVELIAMFLSTKLFP